MSSSIATTLGTPYSRTSHTVEEFATYSRRSPSTPRRQAIEQLTGRPGALQDVIKPEPPEMRRRIFECSGVFAAGRSQAGGGNAGMVQFAGVTYIPAFQSDGG